jgi:type 2 lantibiotic biosynthesis protein LanM
LNLWQLIKLVQDLSSPNLPRYKGVNIKMKVLQQDLIAIVERASTLNERLSDRFEFIPTDNNQKQIDSRIEAWCQASAAGNSQKFAKRLTWDDLDLSKPKKILGDVRFVDEQLPVWTETLRAALETDWEIARTEASGCLDPEKPIPFEEVYLPFIWLARTRLIEKVGENRKLLSDEVYVKLERQLLLRFTSLCVLSLQSQFVYFKAMTQPTLSETEPDDTSDRLYQAFIEQLKAGGLLTFFQDYSALARLLSIALDFWVEEKAEFIQRLAADLPAIEQEFSVDIDRVTAIESDLSDAHNKGRSVLVLTFASGFKLVYKPRSLALEATYFQLLDWCDRQQVLLPFKILKVIDRHTHGWMEHVEHLPCENETAAQRYYQRAGMLLCWFYVLHGSDFHNENLIANGEHPVPVDLEVLVNPLPQKLNPKEPTAYLYLSGKNISDSVLSSGLLPTPKWEFETRGTNEDTSGFGGNDRDMSIHKLDWSNINTDRMTLKQKLSNVPIQKNLPYQKNTVFTVKDYADQLIDGFGQMYQFFLERQTELLSPNSPLAVLAHQKVRFLFRQTQLYADVLSRVSQPKFLRFGIDRSIQLDLLSRAYLVADPKPNIWKLQKHEVRGLEQMDIPLLLADTDSVDFQIDDRTKVEGYFQQPSYERVITRLQQLSDVDMNQQIEMIRASLNLRLSRGISVTSSHKQDFDSLELSAIDNLQPEELVKEAVEIATILEQMAIRADNGSINWIGMVCDSDAKKLQPQPLEYDLYSGVSGVALFLAALAKVTGEVKYRNLAMDALANVQMLLRDNKSELFREKAQKMEIGGAGGLGSIVYSLAKTARFLNEPQLLDTAKVAASLITDEAIERDRQFDIIAGSAGAILGLLALYDLENNSMLLEQTRNIGYYLLNNRVKSDSGIRAWATIDKQPVTGFSHGAAGIAYALLRLYEVTQEKTFLEAATEAIAYEQSVFSPSANNWPDIKNFSLERGEPMFGNTWCYGAPGIALGRLGGLSILDTPKIREEISVAIDTTLQCPLHSIDHLCCGNFGRIEVLQVAAQKLSSSNLQTEVCERTALTVARAKQIGDFCLPSEFGEGVYDPSFFRGTAGIGYQLLRIAHPDLLPSVLMWE